MSGVRIPAEPPFRRVAQLAEQELYKLQDVGSSPISPTTCFIVREVDMTREELIEGILNRMLAGARSGIHKLAMHDSKWAAAHGKPPVRRLKPMQALRKAQQLKTRRQLGIGIENRLGKK